MAVGQFSSIKNALEYSKFGYKPFIKGSWNLLRIQFDADKTDPCQNSNM